MKRRKKITKSQNIIILLTPEERELIDKLCEYHKESISNVGRELLLIGIEETEAEAELKQWEEKQRLKRVAEWVGHRDT